MPDVPFTDLFAAPVLCGVIETVKSGLYDVLPPGMDTNGQTVEKDYGEYTEVYGTREVAKIAAYGSTSQQASLKNVGKKGVKLFHTIEHINFPIADYMSILQADSLIVDEKGVAEVKRQITLFRKRFDNLRMMASMAVLFNNAIYWDVKGNLTPTSAGSQGGATFGVPASHQGQLPELPGSANIITDTWLDPAAPIMQMCRVIRQQSLIESGYMPKYALYGSAIPDAVLNNTELAKLIIRNNTANPKFLETAEIPSPLAGFTWVPAYDSFWIDQNGNPQSFVGPNQVCFIPEPSIEWWEIMQGQIPVADSVGVTPEASLANIRKVAGPFAYAVTQTNPVQVQLIAGDTFMPVLKVPKAIWTATVIF